MDYKNRLPILIDLDDTIVSMKSVWLKKYYEKTGDLVSENSFLTWNFDSYVKHKDAFHDILAEDGFFYHLDPIPGAIEAITKLIEKKLDIVFLTQPPRRSDYAVRDKRKWIQKYFKDFPLTNIIFAHRKELVRGSTLIDDAPSHLQNFKERNPLAETMAINYPYNQTIQVSHRFDKDVAWDNFYKIICNEYEV